MNEQYHTRARVGPGSDAILDFNSMGRVCSAKVQLQLLLWLSSGSICFVLLFFSVFARTLAGRSGVLLSPLRSWQCVKLHRRLQRSKKKLEHTWRVFLISLPKWDPRSMREPLFLGLANFPGCQDAVRGWRVNMHR